MILRAERHRERKAIQLVADFTALTFVYSHALLQAVRWGLTTDYYLGCVEIYEPCNGLSGLSRKSKP